jgi:drug/metabolite transporter (DMT)-like permease
MQTHAQSLSSNSHGVVIMIVEPIWTALMAAAWFGESLSEKELIGCVLVFISIIIIRWTLIQRLLKRATA